MIDKQAKKLYIMFVLQSLSQRKDDVGKQIRRVCAEVRRNPCAEFAPVLSLYEKRLLNLVSLIQTVQSQVILLLQYLCCLHVLCVYVCLLALCSKVLWRCCCVFCQGN